MKRRILLVAAIILVAFVASAVVAAQPMQQAQPTLVNAGLDEPYTRRGADEVMIANGWLDPVWRGRRPECKPSDIAKEGEAQKCFVRFDDLYVAIGQQPQNIQAGDILKVTAWVYPWSSQRDDVTKCQAWDGDEVNYGKLAARVCINWWGADPFNEPYSTACSVQALECGEWNKLEVTAKIQSPNAKIWLLTETRVKASHQDVWWDKVTVEKVTDPTGPTPTACPTYTPYPTYTPGTPGAPIDYERIKSDVATVVVEWDLRR